MILNKTLKDEGSKIFSLCLYFLHWTLTCLSHGPTTNKYGYLSNYCVPHAGLGALYVFTLIPQQPYKEDIIVPTL